MRAAAAAYLIVMIATLAAPSGLAQTAAPPPSRESLVVGLAAAEQALATSSNDYNALYNSAMFNLQLGNLLPARGRIEQLVKTTGNSYLAWELLAQIAQNQGDLERRNEAVRRIPAMIRSAVDPTIRRKTSFARDRIATPGFDLLVNHYFESGGMEFTRYLFFLVIPGAPANRLLALRTDVATTDNWAATALIPPDQPLFHLDMVDTAQGNPDKVAIYEYYVGEPDYDTVRATAMKILRGEARPLSGQPGSLAGILRR